jgi:bifunctional UDP-N-acetylglucosamine pyrophosphorylase/glucosamine-1-phosphate N-acetyltransferase
MKKIAVIMLAAGKSTRMKSSLVKVLHPIAGQPMIKYSLEVVKKIKPEKTIIVIGYQADKVRSALGDDPSLVFVDQPDQLGTGHAVICTRPALADFHDTVLIICGDVPLLRRETLQSLLSYHEDKGSHLTVLTTRVPEPTGYGRVCKDTLGGIVRIVEEKDATLTEKLIREVNTGIFCVDADFLFSALEKIGNANAQGEYYLTSIVDVAAQSGVHAYYHIAPDCNEVMGINNRLEMSRASEQIKKQILEALMIDGVTIVDPACTYIEKTVKIGKDTVVYPNCNLRGRTAIGEECLIDTGCVITDSTVGNRVTMKPYSVLGEARVMDEASIGPFANLRAGSLVEGGAKIGNFVETKKAHVGKGTKIAHLSYIGDAVIGENVNVGAGTITCNYDGEKKHQTVIEDGAFIGSDTQFVAPVKVGKNAYVGAGSTITKDVPAGALAVSRVKQEIIPGYAERKFSLGQGAQKVEPQPEAKPEPEAQGNGRPKGS